MITIIQVQGGALLIGEVETMSPEYITIISPRVIQMQQTSPNQVRIQFAVMIGAPKEARLNQEMIAMYYIPDEALNNTYREAVTGLTLAKAIPSGTNVKPFPGRNN